MNEFHIYCCNDYYRSEISWTFQGPKYRGQYYSSQMHGCRNRSIFDMQTTPNGVYLLYDTIDDYFCIAPVRCIGACSNNLRGPICPSCIIKTTSGKWREWKKWPDQIPCHIAFIASNLSAKHRFKIRFFNRYNKYASINLIMHIDSITFNIRDWIPNLPISLNFVFIGDSLIKIERII